MRAFLGTVLSIIAVGVLLIAYGLLAPRAGAFSSTGQPGQVMFDPQTGTYQVARPILANERFEVGPDGRVYATTSPQGVGASSYLVTSPYGPAAAGPQVVTYAPAARPVTVASTAPARQTVRRTTVTEPRRDWKKTAMVIGGTTATGAGIGAIFGGKKGAAIGAAIGGGAGTLYEVRKR
jgi:hypothetical protein